MKRERNGKRCGKYFCKQEREYGCLSLIPCGSSLKICRVAEGSADVYPSFASPWNGVRRQGMLPQGLWGGGLSDGRKETAAL